VQNIQPGSSEQGQSEDVKLPEKYLPVDQKIPVEIRDVFRIRPGDFQAFKSSFEEWSKQWE